MSPGLRLLLLVAAPLLGALLTHELRRRPVAAAVVAAASVLACAALALTIIPAVAGGGAVERSLGPAISGVDLTLRADSASLAIIIISCVAALLALPRQRASGARAAGLVLSVAGTATVATGGNLVLVAAGVEVIAGSTLLLRGRRGPGRRSAAVLAGLQAIAGLALVSTAAQLVAVAGSSDLAFVPQSAVGGAVGVPWALAGIALVVSPLLLGNPAAASRDWGAVAALPAGFLVVLRLQQSAGGQLPGIAAVTLAVAGGVVAVAAVLSARGAPDVSTVGRSVLGVVVGVLLSLAAGPLATVGTVVAGLFLTAELALLAAPVWGRRPSAWSAASIALLALPGGAAFAVAAVGVGAVAARGDAAFPQLVILVATLSAGAVIAARVLVTAPGGWARVTPGPALALACAAAGSLVPGLLLRQFAAPLAGNAAALDLDAATLQAPGAGFAAGYFTLAIVLLAVAGAAAFNLAADGPLAAGAPTAPPRRVPAVTPLLQIRRLAAPHAATVRDALDRADRWLEGQPHLPLVVGAAALAVLFFR